MHHENFLQDLAVVMMVAGLVTILCHRFKQPVVLGYILAGLIIGPHTPPFPLIKSQETIATLSELGIIFLMFSLGLEFSLRKLKEVGPTALVAATLEIAVMMGLGYGIGPYTSHTIVSTTASAEKNAGPTSDCCWIGSLGSLVGLACARLVIV
jgi:CPA2 family monovalent cation:H+ antiporter-2